MNRETIARILLLAAALIVMVFFPRFTDEYQVRIVNQIVSFSLFALSFNLLFGYAGLLSFGQAAYFGLGAYVTAFLINFLPGLPLPFSILLGGLAAAIGAFIIGIFCVRLTGAYFALLTLAFSQFLFAIAFKARSLTGGDDGMSVAVKSMVLPVFGNIDLTRKYNVYYIEVIFAVVVIYLCWHLTKTPFGNAIKCIKQNEERTNFIGYNPFATKVGTFVIAGLVAGIGGSLFALNEGFVSTDVMDIHRSTMCMLMAFLGGTNSFLGPVLGAGIYTYLTDWLSGYTAYWELIIGAIFITMILYFREGFMSLLTLIDLKKIMLLRKVIANWYKLLRNFIAS